MTREEALEVLRREARSEFARMGLDEDAMMERYRPEDDDLLPYLMTGDSYSRNDLTLLLIDIEEAITRGNLDRALVIIHEVIGEE
jgi:hypothetical protein